MAENGEKEGGGVMAEKGIPEQGVNMSKDYAIDICSFKNSSFE